MAKKRFWVGKSFNFREGVRSGWVGSGSKSRESREDEEYEFNYGAAMLWGFLVIVAIFLVVALG